MLLVLEGFALIKTTKLVFVFPVFWHVCGKRNTGLFVHSLAFV